VRLARSAAVLVSAHASRITVRLHGACIGAGIEVPAGAGRVEALPDTVVALPEVGMGLVPGAGGTATVPRRVGRHRTCWLGLTGARLDAATACAWGLVDAVVDGW
jgi:enoyl-CoA hydratase/carnithine racemase